MNVTSGRAQLGFASAKHTRSSRAYLTCWGADVAKHGDIAKGPGWELRCGDWQQVLADVQCDALITDPPYSQRTATGQRSASTKGSATRTQQPVAGRIRYGHITSGDCAALARQFAGALWFVVFGDHLTAGWHRAAAEAAGRYVFAPVPWCKPDAAPRLRGDGPPSAVEWITASRTRGKDSIAVIRKQPPGYYLLGTMAHRRAQVVVGGKPAPLMRSIVRDYSLPGALVCDPFAGGATTLLAAVMEGRRAIGAELDPETFEKAVARLSRGYTPDLFAGAPTAKPVQTSLLGGQ